VAGAALKGNSASVAQEPKKPARLAENNSKDGAIPESRKRQEIAATLEHHLAKCD
jgi:hypothetical protein